MKNLITSLRFPSWRRLARVLPILAATLLMTGLFPATSLAADTDGDGVDDLDDICPFTPLGYTVDGAGCDAFCEVVDQGADVFLRSRLLEVGVAAAASFGSAGIAPVGWHPRPGGGTNRLGFTANPQKNNWASFNGDFFVPGSPEEGFGLRVGSNNYFNSTLMGLNQIPGDFTGIRVECEPLVCGMRGGGSVFWQGSVAGITVNHTYSVLNEGLFILVNVKLTNTTASDQLIYYMRNVDPDNQQPLTGSYSTTNTIVSQGNGTSTSEALVSATTAAVGGASASYLALISSDPDARVTYGGFSNRDPMAVWNCTGFTCTVGSSMTSDIAISLAVKKTIPAGGMVEFSYAYTLDPVEVITATDCTAPSVCGDGVIEGTESCDDLNTQNNDGCASDCKIETGYSCLGEPSVCTDDDECTLGTDNCSANATCTNTLGGFSCACNAGFSGDGVTCTDLDECTLGTDNCHANAT
ncbi:MAG: hypothetical protein CVU59_11655, partial [Deltaproteobacteria bacterium HGW-Deltaproteobacteria-17]